MSQQEQQENSAKPEADQSSGSHHDWGDTADPYDKYISPVTGLHCRTMISVLSSRLSHSSPVTILDIGCGTGTFSLQYLHHFPHGNPNHTIISVDISAGMVERARARILPLAKSLQCQSHFEFYQSDGTHLSDIPTDSVDVAVATFSIFHSSDDEAFLKAVKRVLAPNNSSFVIMAWMDENEIINKLATPVCDKLILASKHVNLAHAFETFYSFTNSDSDLNY